MVPLPHFHLLCELGKDPLSVILQASSPGGSGSAKRRAPPLPEHLRELARRLFIRVCTQCILDPLGEE